MKFCRRCEQDKAGSEFYFDSTRGKLCGYCKQCHLRITSDWKGKNKHIVAESARKRYRKSPEKFKEASKQWRTEHHDLFKKRARQRQHQLWIDCINGLGGACKCCGQALLTMLEIDHVEGGGNKHRRLSGGSVAVYNQIKLSGYPKDKFQVLCANCNQSKRRNLGICEHQTTDRSAEMGFCV